MHWIFVYIIIFIFSLVLSFIFTPIFKTLAIRINLVDTPKQQLHKSHSKAIPLLGGMGICTSWILTILLGLILIVFCKGFFPNFLHGYMNGIAQTKPRILVIMLGGIAMTLLGFFDDKHTMSAKTKFLWQVIITILVVTFANIKITLFINSEFINWCITVFWILLIVNAINFFDNMDGLAAGIASIAFFFFTLTAILFEHYFVASLGAATLGATMGFWFFNRYPAKIFMGDCGSHFLGYTLAITGALTTYYQQGITQTPLAVLIPIFILAVPLFDLFSVVIIRIKINKPIYIGDNNHISHRFNKMGLERKTAVFCVHLLAIIISLGVLPLLWGNIMTAFVCLIQVCIILLLISILQYTIRS